MWHSASAKQHRAKRVHETMNTLRPRQNGRHFADDLFKCIFLNENGWISIKISLNFVPNGLINNILALVLKMAWRRSGDKPLSEPMVCWRMYASLGLNELRPNIITMTQQNGVVWIFFKAYCMCFFLSTFPTIPCLITHWGQVMQIYVSELDHYRSNNNLSPYRRQVVIWTSDGILLIGLFVYIIEIWIKIRNTSLHENKFIMSSANFRQFSRL